MKEEALENDDKFDQYRSKPDGNDFTNIYENPDEVNIYGKKSWDDYDDKFGTRPSEITIYLKQNNNRIGWTKAYAKDNWKYKFIHLPKYDQKGKEYKYTLEEVDVPGYTLKEQDGYNLTNQYKNNEVTSVSGDKFWDDYDNIFETRPQSIKVELYQGDSEEAFDTKEVTEKEDGTWSYVFDNLPKYDEKGKEYVYSVKEAKVKEGEPGSEYDVTYDGNNITNTYKNNDKTNLKVEKAWVNDSETLDDRPDEITIYLTRNSELVKPDGSELEDGESPAGVQVTAADNWEYIFSDLPMYDDKGIAYTYDVIEDSVPKYLTEDTKLDDSDPSNIVLSLTNTHRTEMFIAGEKIWDDYDDLHKPNAPNVHPVTRPDSIEVELLRDGKSTDPKTIKTVTAKDNWQYIFDRLPVSDPDTGEDYVYTVKEPVVPDGYEKPIYIGNNIINRFRSTEKIEIDGEKIWDDLDNKFKLQPESITMELYQNNKKIDDVIVNAKSDWKFSFDELDKYDNEGRIYEYNVKERVPNGYKISEKELVKDPENENHLTYTFTNYYRNQDTVPIKGDKEWLDYDNKFNTRPESITVNLYQSVKENDAQAKLYDTRSIGAKDNWEYSFGNVPKYDDNGELYYYTVKETPVLTNNNPQDPGETYESEIIGNDIINTYIVNQKTSISGLKEWDDYNDKFNTRPESIIVELYKNDNYVDEVIVNESSDWKYKFTDLDVYDPIIGEENIYTVKEKASEDTADKFSLYEQKVTASGFKNTYINKKTISLSGEKTWVDYNNVMKTRPTEITVELYRNNEEEAYDKTIVTPNDKNEWKYTFDNLPKYDANGDEYLYTVKELPVEGYKVEYLSNNSIKNTLIDHEVSELEIVGQKTWSDANDKYGLRPESIIVDLYREGLAKPVDTQEVKPDSKGKWIYIFNQLEKYSSDGEEYTYYVEERFVDNYEPTYNGTSIINTLELISIDGKKEWVDKEDKLKVRPDSIKVNLYRDDLDVPIEEKVVKPNESGEWLYTFDELLKTDENGREYTYRVEEESVAHYTSQVLENGIDLVNTYDNDEVIIIEGEKTWKDKGMEQYRPDYITVNLYSKEVSKPVETLQVKPDKDGNWLYTFDNLPKYDENLIEIEYFIEEEQVDSYESKVNGYNIENTYVPKDPEDPKDPEKPEVPGDPEEPKDPTKPEQPNGEDNDKPKDNNPKKPGKTGDLPKTGEESVSYFIFGVLIIGFVTIYGRFYRKKY